MMKEDAGWEAAGRGRAIFWRLDPASQRDPPDRLVPRIADIERTRKGASQNAPGAAPGNQHRAPGVVVCRECFVPLPESAPRRQVPDAPLHNHISLRVKGAYWATTVRHFCPLKTRSVAPALLLRSHRCLTCRPVQLFGDSYASDHQGKLPESLRRKPMIPNPRQTKRIDPGSGVTIAFMNVFSIRTTSRYPPVGRYST